MDGGGEGGGGMKTVECLRGRLLAERVASKAAKEEADQLSKRVSCVTFLSHTCRTTSSSLISVSTQTNFDLMVGLGHSWTSWRRSSPMRSR